MKTPHISHLSAILSLLLVFSSARAFAQHGHLDAGAVGTKQGDALAFANAAAFVLESGYVKTLTYTNAGTYAGFYQGSITLTALPATATSGGPSPKAPALGSFINVSVDSVEGPPGGSFAFWETGATSPTVTLPVGERGATLWRLSSGDGTPGSDPFGHLHGRRFTATKPGLYKVGFKLFDTSTNGADGGPIHSPSEPVLLHFQAGVTITSLVAQAGKATVTFGAANGLKLGLEYTTNLGGASWIPAGDPVAGNDHFQTITDPGAASPNRFYRLKSITP